MGEDSWHDFLLFYSGSCIVFYTIHCFVPAVLGYHPVGHSCMDEGGDASFPYRMVNEGLLLPKPLAGIDRDFQPLLLF